MHKSSLRYGRCSTIIVFLFSCPANTLAATQTEIQEWLTAHNEYRTIHGVAPLAWSATVAISAKNFADTCPSAHSGVGYGENLSWSTNNRSADEVVKGWYDEEPLYDYSNPGYSPGTGHFTQIIWKESTEVGCGFTTGCGADWPYMSNAWVCQYNPPGNYIGKFEENVLPPNTENSGEPNDSNSMAALYHLLLLR